MTVSSVRAKHRSARRPGAAFSVITQAATDQMTSVGRRTAVVAASSGLLVSMIGAAPASGVTQESVALDKSKTLDFQAAPIASVGSNTVSVPADATFVIETATVTVTPAPVEAPEPQRQTRASRDAQRDAAPQEQQAAPQEAAPRAVAPSSVDGNEVISIAARYIGVPYVYGGSTPDGFDCSGFTAYVYAQLGISLPHSSRAQSQVGTRVSRDEARPGDLVWTPGHIAIYAGDGMIIDASRPGEVVDFRRMWQSNPVFIRVN